MSSKRAGVCNRLLNAGGFLVIFGWLAFLTIHKIKDDERHEKGEPFARQKRESGGQGSQNVNTGGAIYVRWGRTVCPVDAELVYKGFVGGGHFHDLGGGSNYVCLTEDPKYANIKPGEDAYSVVFGTEFDVSGYSLFSTVNSYPNALHNSDVLCAVCRSSTKTSSVMIPGTNECPNSDWNNEYWGYLMTSHYAHKAQHDFVCVDNAPEKGTEGGATNEDGALMHHVEGRCGSLPCQPYDNGAELTCVVCTK